MLVAVNDKPELANLINGSLIRTLSELENVDMGLEGCSDPLSERLS